MRAVLVLVCRELEKAHVRFGIGASLLLMAYGIVDKASDIDLIVHIEDVLKAKEIMDSLGVLEPSSDHNLYYSEVFLEYKVDSVDVDIMANFTIKTEEGLHLYPFSEEEIVIMGPEKLPYLSLEKWEKAYRLMERTKKADLVSAYLNGKKE